MADLKHPGCLLWLSPANLAKILLTEGNTRDANTRTACGWETDLYNLHPSHELEKHSNRWQLQNVMTHTAHNLYTMICAPFSVCFSGPKAQREYQIS